MAFYRPESSAQSLPRSRGCEGRRGMDIVTLLRKFERVKKKNGQGFSARCPSHEDRKNSLTITEADGKILIKCFAGCDAQSVTAAVGLKLSDLFADQKDRPRDPVVKQYIYSDEDGRALFRVCRTESKDFFQQ